MAEVDERDAAEPRAAQPSEEELRAAYEAELSRITSSEMILQTTVSLINIGGRRLGLGSPSSDSPAGATPDQGAPSAERDLEQVRDAIDGASALLPILERRMPRELGPLRDAVSQLQMAYARAAQSTAPAEAASTPKQPPSSGEGGSGEQPDRQQSETPSPGPGPAEASGRLWVPGR